MFVRGITTFCQNHNTAIASIDFVGAHIPSLSNSQSPEIGNSNIHSLGWTKVITTETGLTVVFDFTIVEQGIPRPHTSPVTFVDRLLLRHPHKFRACLDIDELASLCFIPTLVDGNTRATLSCSCGPGSLLIDYAMRYSTSNALGEDYDGEFAAQGNVHNEIVNQFLTAHDYLHEPPALSIAREMFGDHDAQKIIDECLLHNLSDVVTVATFTRITAMNILKQYYRLLQHFFPDGQTVHELFICGPSARNVNIIDYLEAELPESVITKPLDDIGIRADANRAVCYAHLALEAVLGRATRPLTSLTPTSPQANHDLINGWIICGTTWEKLVEQLLQFSEGRQVYVTKNIVVKGSLETAINGLDLG